MPITLSRTFDSLLQYIRSFTHSHPFQNLVRFLDGEVHEHILSTLSNNGDVRVFIEGPLGKLSYDKTVGRIGKHAAIEEVEFIPYQGGVGGFSFTVVDNELSIVRRDGSEPEYSPRISLKESAEISVFLNQLRLKTEAFLQARRT